MGLPKPVKKLSRDRNVVLPSGPVYDGDEPRASSVPSPVTIKIRMAIQRESGRPPALVRTLDGDETEGQIKIWVTDRNLAAAEDVTNPGVPLGLTKLPIAPPEGEDGPPGARVDYEGRRYELDRDLSIGESLGPSKKPGFKRYRASEIGGAA